MCGIAGIWGRVDPGALRTMGRCLAHRGPDDEGIWTQPEAGVGLVSRRLAVIDLEGGHQPIFNRDGRIVTVCNGEIYNYRELREELIAKGYRFTTQTDTEVIVHLYEESGLDFVDRLRGMFAIAIWDDRQRQLVLARDRAGKKPLYYTEDGDEFCFASEIKALAHHRRAASRPLEIDDQSLADYLAWTAVPAPGTIYRAIRAALPAHVMVVRERRVHESRRYWHLRIQPKIRIRPADAVDRIDALIRESVHLRLRSDVPVGVFLSGGIDSGIITAMAAAEYPGRITTISIGFEDGEFDERPLARRVAQQYGTDHHEVLVRPDAAEILPRIAAAYDQPFADSSAIPSYYAAEAARRHVKVVLNGDGGDEVFAGYRRYVAAHLGGRLGRLDGPAMRAFWRMLADALPVPRSFRTSYAFGHRWLRGLGADSRDRYLAWAVDGIDHDAQRALGGQGEGPSSYHPWLARDPSSVGLGPVDSMLADDFHTVLPDDLLVKMDIATMAHGLEARSPLLDHVLIEAVSPFPESLKLHGLQTKPLLRKLALRYLPIEVRTAPKRGFEIPRLRWLRHELRELRDDIVLSPSGLLAERFDRDRLERFLRRPRGVDPGRWAGHVWILLMLGLWDRYVRRARFDPAEAAASTSTAPGSRSFGQNIPGGLP